MALIVDGNRRWARARGLPYEWGYAAAGENLVRLVCHAATLGIETVSAFLFSTENWRRERAEVLAVMRAFEALLQRYTALFVRRGVRVRVIGDVTALPRGIRDALARAEVETAGGGMNFVMAFNYGGRWDLERAARAWVAANLAGPLSSHLATSEFGDPDLLIRTGAARRLSNFMLWQLAYTELHFSDLLWPEFGVDAFEAALADFARRERRLGA